MTCPGLYCSLFGWERCRRPLGHDGDHGPATSEERDEKRLSYTQRLTLRNEAMLERGVHPATEAPLREGNETCGSCVHLSQNRRFFKCDLVVVTNGPKTDVRKGWPACQRWEPAS